MKSTTVICLSALAGVLLSSHAYSRERIPWVTPGAYAAAYTCPGQSPVPVDFYVFDRTITVEYKSGDEQQQGVRVELDGGQFVATVIVAGIDTPRFSSLVKERAPLGGWGSVPDSFDFTGPAETMRGDVVVNGQTCLLAPRATPAPKTLASMDFAPIPEVIDYSTRRDGVPETFQPFAPGKKAADALSAAIRQTIVDDSQSWMANRLDASSIANFNFFSSAAEPGLLYAWSRYRYVDINNIASDGWVVSRVKEGRVECLRFHDRSRCTQPRQSYSAQIASLGAGRQRLGVMIVEPTCFTERVALATRSEERVVRANPTSSDIDTVTQTVTTPTHELVFACPTQSFELECVAEGLDRYQEWLLGSGSSRSHKINLVRNRVTDVGPDVLANYNMRIERGTCVRVK